MKYKVCTHQGSGLTMIGMPAGIADSTDYKSEWCVLCFFNEMDTALEYAMELDVHNAIGMRDWWWAECPPRSRRESP